MYTFFQTDPATFRLTIEATSARFELRDISNNDPRVSVFGGTANMRLRSLLITSGGTFQGRVDGSLSLFGKSIASGDYDVSLSGGLLRLTIPSSRRATINLGFFRVGVSGFVQSDGQFDVSGSATTVGAFPGVSWSGSAAMRVRNAGISGSYDGCGTTTSKRSGLRPRTDLVGHPTASASSSSGVSQGVNG